MAKFLFEIDILNRALQHLGARQLETITDNSVEQQETTTCYDKLRRMELERNIWRFSVKKTVLYPLSPSTLFLVPAVWAIGTTYLLGDVVQDANGQWWVSTVPGNIGNSPGSASQWDTYWGPISCDLWNIGNNTGTNSAYFNGDLVYQVNQVTGAITVYRSQVSSNQDPPTGTPTVWNSGSSTAAGSSGSATAISLYTLGQVVSFNGVNYQSLWPYNFGNQPNITPDAWTTTITNPTNSIQWAVMTGMSVRTPNIIYPVGSGPSTEEETRNVFMLPYGYVKVAPQDPKAGSTNFLGAPSNLWYDDYTYGDQYFTSRTFEPIVFRFAADITQVPSMTSLFCEGLAAKIAEETCVRITGSVGKLQVAAQAYSAAMGQARLTNGIEEGPTEPPLDDFIACRS